MKPVAGQESLNDYPGPAGLMEQIRAGVRISQLPEKLAKAKQQVGENTANLAKIRLDQQITIQRIDTQMREFKALAAELVKAHRRVYK